jgi:hypothetical protein
MTKPMIRIHDLETNEIVDREMTDAEFKKHQDAQAESKILNDEKAAKEAAKVSALGKLAALGLTTDEVTAILG